MPPKKLKQKLQEEIEKREKETQQLEEEERQQKLVEDARKKEEEKIHRELKAKELEVETARLESEYPAMQDEENRMYTALDWENRAVEIMNEWKEHLQCRNLPDSPADFMTCLEEIRGIDIIPEMQLGAYIEPPILPAKVVQNSVDVCNDIEVVAQHLQQLFCASLESKADRIHFLSYLDDLRKVQFNIMNRAINYLLQRLERPNTVSDKEAILKPELMAWWKGGLLKIGLFANTSKQFRGKSIQWDALGINVDLPRSIAQHVIGFFVGLMGVFCEFDHVGFGKTSQFLPIGGILNLQLLGVPPFPRQMKGWEVRPDFHKWKDLMIMPYPNAQVATAAHPSRIEYLLPSNVVIDENCEVRWWDKENYIWSKEHVTDFKVESTESLAKRVSFFALKLTMYAVVQDRTVDFPYKWWYVRPLSKKCFQFTIQCYRDSLKFSFRVSCDGIQLETPVCQELQELTNLLPMKASELLTKLKYSGINLLPENTDTELISAKALVRKSLASPSVEAKAYREIARLSRCFHIVSSTQNKYLGSDRVIFRLRDRLEFDSFDPHEKEAEIDFKWVMCWEDKAALVDVLETTTDISELLSTDAKNTPPFDVRFVL
eukprot:GHVL01013398.1.p1 GENE.GHVL01013398.1~~GHVL01013398.1.p1  ORF type:complete len:603 (+),score=96.37 GHVL01013398.1:273-2081(+)